MLASIAVAWFGAVLHAAGRAPIGLISISLGVVLGALIGSIAATGHNGRRGPVAVGRRVILAAVTLSVITILAQHAFLYLEFRRQWHEAREKSPHAALFRSEEFEDDAPLSPADYFRHEATPRRIALWCIDATLITLSAATTTWLLHRHAAKFLAMPSPPLTPDR
jgi:hypothetical protein